MKSNWWPAHLYNAGGLTLCLVPFNLQYPIPAGSSRTEIIVFKQQLPLDLSFSLIHLLSPLSVSVLLSLTHADCVWALTPSPPSWLPSPPLLHSHPLFYWGITWKREKDEWCTSWDGCQMWNVTQQSYITLGTRTYSPPAATPTSKWGFQPNQEDWPKVWPSFTRSWL